MYQPEQDQSRRLTFHREVAIVNPRRKFEELKLEANLESIETSRNELEDKLLKEKRLYQELSEDMRKLNWKYESIKQENDNKQRNRKQLSDQFRWELQELKQNSKEEDQNAAILVEALQERVKRSNARSIRESLLLSHFY